MPELKSIPDDVKWRLASRCAAMFPAMYDRVFRTVAGNRYDSLEQEIWIELSRMVCDIVHDLSLPVGNAHDIGKSIWIVMSILFGPEYKGETLEVSQGGAIVLVKRCPFLMHGQKIATEQDIFFAKCMAITLTSVPLLNKNYTARFVRTMCTGDRQCEIKIEPEKNGESRNPAK